MKHFVRMARFLAYGRFWWADMEPPTFLKRLGLVNYQVIAETPAGETTAQGRILFVTINVVL